MFERVAIIGVGLIGGSLGMALLDRRLARSVVGIGRSEENLRLALTLQAVTEYTTDPAAGVRGADLIVLATPVGAILPTLERIASHLAPGATVTDVGSTKEQIVARAETVIPSACAFVGGHPMAGAETAGVRHADRYLFEGAFWVLTPTPRTLPQALECLRRMAARLGSRVIELAPAEHDLMVAAVSHLPHIVAAALANTVGDMAGGDRALSLAAGGFRDTTRIAASSPEMWRDIFASNRDKVLQMLWFFRHQIEQAETILRAGDHGALTAWLAAARATRRAVPARVKGYLYDLHDLTVTVPDRPGAIASVTAALAAEGINLCDLEILRVREGEAGTVRLAFASIADRDHAAAVLSRNGIPVRVK
ncbi:MAG: prephenate dehydrogenase [Bacillota bacterium]|nr:prephenate dehydrogenase [Bacillota bacterium]